MYRNSGSPTPGNVKIEKIIARAVRLYNKYRSPEAISRIVKINENSVEILFEGHFCKTCAINDWIEDFKYVLEDMGIEAELENIIEPSKSRENWRIGVFRLKNINFES